LLIVECATIATITAICPRRWCSQRCNRFYFCHRQDHSPLSCIGCN
jgi:hypothetical protein